MLSFENQKYISVYLISVPWIAHKAALKDTTGETSIILISIAGYDLMKLTN